MRCVVSYIVYSHGDKDTEEEIIRSLSLLWPSGVTLVVFHVEEECFNGLILWRHLG